MKEIIRHPYIDVIVLYENVLFFKMVNTDKRSIQEQSKNCNMYPATDHHY